MASISKSANRLVVVAVLPVRDIAASVKFYERLGFRALSVWGTDYALLDRSGAGLHLRFASAELKSGKNPSGVYVYAENLDGFYAEVVTAGVKPLGPITEFAWGKEFSIEDLDGNLLRVGELIDED